MTHRLAVYVEKQFPSWQHKLAALTDPHVWFVYRIGVLRTLAKTEIASSEVYVGGVVERPMSIWFAGRLHETGLSASKAY